MLIITISILVYVADCWSSWAQTMLWTLDKGVRVAFWGGVSALLASLLDVLGLASCRLAFPAAWILTAATYLYCANLTVRDIFAAGYNHLQ